MSGVHTISVFHHQFNFEGYYEFQNQTKDQIDFIVLNEMSEGVMRGRERQANTARTEIDNSLFLLMMKSVNIFQWVEGKCREKEKEGGVEKLRQIVIGKLSVNFSKCKQNKNTNKTNINNVLKSFNPRIHFLIAFLIHQDTINIKTTTRSQKFLF